ncbi:GerAB/ArcD/ProY family transporter [Oxobacter pfennigii]|uniref:GerAB/ArcD/ProY family transporter n=1 Tax=Oxobacter pfennigii TaxID=36849 RepID=UPI0006D3DC41|nr:endospore germination permease [Oxobacter pfennigii]
MSKEVISNKQAISIMVIFLSGTSSASLFGITAGKDVWMAVVLSVLAALITGIGFAKIHFDYPDKNLFDVLEICFGKIGGKIIGLLFTAYFFQTGIDVLSNITFFIQTVTLPETPRLATIFFIMLLCLWVAKEGTEVLGRWTEFFIPLYITAIFIAVILLIPKMELKNIQPMLYDGIKPVLRGAFYTFSFPFGEIVIFSAIFSSFQSKKFSFKVYIVSLLLGGIMVLIVSLTDLLVLGVDVASELYYPSYSVVSKIDVGNFLQRMEIIAALVMMLGGFVKVSVYLIAISKGLSKVFGYKSYRFLTTPAALLLISTSIFFHKSILEYDGWNNETWPYLAIVFQLFLPAILFFACEIKRMIRVDKKYGLG